MINDTEIRKLWMMCNAEKMPVKLYNGEEKIVITLQNDHGNGDDGDGEKIYAVSAARISNDSAGHKDGLLTQRRLLLECTDVDGEEGYLLAEEVFNRWKEWWENESFN